MLLRYLQLRVIVNGILIYHLEKEKEVIVPLQINRAQVVITDGYHYSQPVEVVCPKIGFQQLTVACTIEDEQFIIGFLLLLLFYAAGFTSDLLLIKIMSFVPLLIFLFSFYIKRKEYLKIKPV